MGTEDAAQKSVKTNRKFEKWESKAGRPQRV